MIYTGATFFCSHDYVLFIREMRFFSSAVIPIGICSEIYFIFCEFFCSAQLCWYVRARDKNPSVYMYTEAYDIE